MESPVLVVVVVEVEVVSRTDTNDFPTPLYLTAALRPVIYLVAQPGAVKHAWKPAFVLVQRKE